MTSILVCLTPRFHFLSLGDSSCLEVAIAARDFMLIFLLSSSYFPQSFGTILVFSNGLAEGTAPMHISDSTEVSTLPEAGLDNHSLPGSIPLSPFSYSAVQSAVQAALLHLSSIRR